MIPSIRAYSAHAGLSQDEVQGRILDLLKNFDKVGHAQLRRERLLADILYLGHRFIKGIRRHDALNTYSFHAHTKKLSPTAHFTNDLGLDSLDTVEVVMAIEEVGCHMLYKREFDD